MVSILVTINPDSKYMYNRRGVVKDSDKSGSDLKAMKILYKTLVQLHYYLIKKGQRGLIKI